MGYLNKETITVDAILTKRGRALLSQGRSAFNITKFAVADDEIDYTLYNPNIGNGTGDYGRTIENMPILEASPDETQSMRFKLVTYSRGQTNIPVVTVQGVTNNTISLQSRAGASAAILKPQTSETTLNQPPFGYTAILYDARGAVLTGNASQLTGTSAITATVPTFLGDSQSSTINAVTAVGTEFSLTPLAGVTQQIDTRLVIIGNQTGGAVNLRVIIAAQSS